MQLTKHTVRALIGLIVVAMLGLAGLQYATLRQAMKLREDLFRKNVYSALQRVVDRAGSLDELSTVFASIDSGFPRGGMLSKNARYTVRRDSKPDDHVVRVFVSSAEDVSTRLQGDTFTYELTQPKKISVRVFDALGRMDTTILDRHENRGLYNLAIPRERLREGTHFIQFRADSFSSVVRWQDGSQTSYVTSTDMDPRGSRKKVTALAKDLFQRDRIPLEHRVSATVLDSLIATSLRDGGIDEPYEFAVFAPPGTRPVVARTSTTTEQVQASPFTTPLFPAELFGPPSMLKVNFPNQRSYLFREFWPELISSLVLMGLTVFCFWFTVRTIVRQKEFAGRLSDFINNMTHEFKTPISTIALASAAIAQQPNIRSGSKLARYNAVIADENKRMKGQVDKILQMATLEEAERDLNVVALDVHQIIERAIANVALQVAAKGGKVTTSLAAERAIIPGDAVHIENVVHNLLDNALKYSPEPPSISVETANEDSWLRIVVRDHGVGIAPEHLGKVFDKYYRVPTGNVHDVKGFGLGLSYVRLIALAHHAKVAIRSTPRSGTEVTLHFPLTPIS